MSVYRFAGDWNSIVTYAPNFVVVSNGLAYVAKETVTGGGEPSTNLAQWEYLPGAAAASFPIVDGDVSLVVDGTSDLVISAGAAYVKVESSLLIKGLLNNDVQDPPPAQGDVLTWNDAASRIEWATAPSSGVSNINLATGSIVIENPTVASVIEVSTDAPSGTITVGIAQAASGVYTEATGGSPNVTITVPGMTADGLVSLTYAHAGGGGGSQYLKTFTAGINQVNLVYNTNVDVGDKIIWGVLKYQNTGPS